MASHHGTMRSMQNGKAAAHEKNNKFWFQRYTEKADVAKHNKRRVERLENQECPYCYYLSSKIGGAAMTLWECALCPRSQVNGSTNTPTLCDECAKR